MRVVSRPGELVWRVVLAPGSSGHVALGPEGIAALDEALAAAAAARVLVITSEGPEFCAGMDLAAALAQDPAALHPTLARFAACLQRLGAGSLVTIAAVEGAASGGGLGLAAACDLVVAGPKASFALPELRVGLVPAVIMPALLRRLRPQQVRRLALTGEALTGAQAAALGLVDVPAEDPAREVDRLVRAALRARPQAVAALRRCCEAEVDGPAQTAADLADPELRTALAALLAEGAAPPWLRRLEGQA